MGLLSRTIVLYNVMFNKEGLTMKVIILFTIFFASLVIAPLGYATNTPYPAHRDARIRWVKFRQNDVVPVKAYTFTSTQIVFGRHEFIEDIQNGDLSAWSVDVAKSLPNMLFLKPTVIDSDTNLTIVTNKHTYYFHLVSISSSKNSKSKIYALHFIYPLESKAAHLSKLKAERHQLSVIQKAALHPGDYNWDYSFNGSMSVKPKAVFDDGVFTYLKYDATQPLPAIFAVDNRAGDESLVNVRRQGPYLIIEQTSPQFTLRLGKHQIATLFNNHEINRLDASHHDARVVDFFDDSEGE